MRFGDGHDRQTRCVNPPAASSQARDQQIDSAGTVGDALTQHQPSRDETPVKDENSGRPADARGQPLNADPKPGWSMEPSDRRLVVFAGVVLGVAGYLVVTNWSGLATSPPRSASARGRLRPRWEWSVPHLSARCGRPSWSESGSGQRARREPGLLVTQLGKYLPGSVWPVVAQMEAGRRWGAGPKHHARSSGLMLAMLTARASPWASSCCRGRAARVSQSTGGP